MRLVAALVCAIHLAVVPSALAQSGAGGAPLADRPLLAQVTEEDGGLVPRPPIEEDGAGDGRPRPDADGSGGRRSGDGKDDPADGRPPAQTGQLPATGADAWWLALVGAGLLLLGVGLRLRTADDRF